MDRGMMSEVDIQEEEPKLMSRILQVHFCIRPYYNEAIVMDCRATLLRTFSLPLHALPQKQTAVASPRDVDA